MTRRKNVVKTARKCCVL